MDATAIPLLPLGLLAVFVIARLLAQAENMVASPARPRGWWLLPCISIGGTLWAAALMI